MLRLKAAVCAALCLIASWNPARAQSQSDLAGQISSTLPDNGRGAITASGLRGVLNSMNGARGQPNGIAGLDAAGRLQPMQFPASGDATGLSLVQGGLTQALPDAFDKRAARVASTASLQGASVSYGRVIREGYASAGDGGAAAYTYSASACPISGGDGGSQIASTVGGCWIIDPSETIRPELFGPRAGTNASNYDDGPRVLKAYQALCNRPGGVGGTIRFSAKQYYFGSSVVFLNPCPVAFVGEPPSEQPLASGTWFHINSTANTTFNVNASGTVGPIGNVAGFSFENLGFYQDQPTPPGGLNPDTQPSLTSWTPTVYPHIFSLGSGGQVKFNNIRAYPVYRFIDERNVGRLEIGNIALQCIDWCFTLDQTYDVVHLTGSFHHWTYWSNNANVQQYNFNNTNIFHIGRVDGMDGGNMFVYGAKAVFNFRQSDSTGPQDHASRWNINTLYADGVYRTITANVSSGVGAGQYPSYIHFGNMHVSCYNLGGANAYAPGTAAVYVAAAGAIDIQFDNLTATYCGTVGGGGAISLNNPNRPSTIQIGTSDWSFLGSINAPAAPVVSSVGPNAGAASNVVFSSPPRVNSNNNMFMANRQFINLTAAQSPTVEVSVANSSTTGSVSLVREYALESTTSPNTGSAFVLPANPWNGAKVSVSGTAAFTGFTVSTSDGATIANAPTSLAAYQSVTFTYRTNLNQWWVN